MVVCRIQGGYFHVINHDQTEKKEGGHVFHHEDHRLDKEEGCFAVALVDPLVVDPEHTAQSSAEDGHGEQPKPPAPKAGFLVVVVVIVDEDFSQRNSDVEDRVDEIDQSEENVNDKFQDR